MIKRPIAALLFAGFTAGATLTFAGCTVPSEQTAPALDDREPTGAAAEALSKCRERAHFTRSQTSRLRQLLSAIGPVPSFKSSRDVTNFYGTMCNYCIDKSDN